MNLFYQRTYFTLGIFFVFMGTYAVYDAGTSLQTTTTMIVIVSGIVFVLGGIYLCLLYTSDAADE